MPADPIPIRTSEDVVIVRQQVRAVAVELGFGLVEQTKIVTAASELGRNTLVHGRLCGTDSLPAVDSASDWAALSVCRTTLKSNHG
jgi:hypothetical protein